jgi:hypothetical protein
MAQPAKADKIAAERRAAIDRTRGMFAHLAPGESLTDELIADRRAEAHMEDRKANDEMQRLRGELLPELGVVVRLFRWCCAPAVCQSCASEAGNNRI